MDSPAPPGAAVGPRQGRWASVAANVPRRAGMAADSPFTTLGRDATPPPADAVVAELVDAQR